MSTPQTYVCISEVSKNPDSDIDLTLDWSGWLLGASETLDDKIVRASAGASPGIPMSDLVFTDTITSVRISGGDLGVDYYISIEIETQLNRTEVRTVRVMVREVQPPE